MAQAWKHDDLAADLAAHLRASTDRVAWCDMQLGPSGSARPDVYTLRKSYTSPQPIAYEIKISRADFLKDVGAGKWQSYLPFSSGVVFAVPEGLIQKADLPAGCGLAWRYGTAWRHVVKPKLSAIDNLPRDVWMKLLIDGLSRAHPQHSDARATWFARVRGNEKIAKAYGEMAGKVVADIDAAQRRLADINHAIGLANKRQADAVAAAQSVADDARRRGEAAAAAQMQDVAQARADLAAALCLPADANIRAIQRATWGLRAALQRDATVQRLAAALDDIAAAAAAARAGL